VIVTGNDPVIIPFVRSVTVTVVPSVFSTGAKLATSIYPLSTRSL